ncbi:MAG TPA: YihY/virulence factor BrkB family protein [Solirubrobacteraceae bacterium]|nr:YihY/virulence factor BrkB family protein [Solirubrobacteraceae bacterium]
MAESTTRTEAPPERSGQTPEAPTDLPKRHWKDIAKRTYREFKDDDLTFLAAALTYYGVLSLFPALLVLVSLLGLIGESATQPLIDNLAAVTPGAARDVVTSAITNLQNASGAAGFAFIFGILGALWSASGYVGGFMKASNIIYEVEEGRPFWKLRPLQIVVTVVLVLVTAAIALSIVLTGPLAQKVGDVIGLGDTAVTVWNIAKWPVIALIVSQVIAFLYWISPNVKQPGYRWVSPGGLVAVVLWVVASAAFAFYVANFGSYNKTYGSLAAVIIFLMWLWITNVVMLFGAEMNAEIERGRQIEGGHPPDKEPFLPPRDPA